LWRLLGVCVRHLWNFLNDIIEFMRTFRSRPRRRAGRGGRRGIDEMFDASGELYQENGDEHSTSSRTGDRASTPGSDGVETSWWTRMEQQAILWWSRVQSSATRGRHSGALKTRRIEQVCHLLELK